MKKLLNFVVVLCLGFNSFSQITINNTLYTPTQLVDGILVPPASGTVVSNVNFQGVMNSSNRYQLGYFTTATTTQAQMGFSSGIVLSSGNTASIPLELGLNPQAQDQMSTGYLSCIAGEIRETGTCPTNINDVNVLAGASNYYNAAILEFDFIPVSSTVQFRYVFGSEEYTDNSGLINYQCSSYNDKFGFLISGPGIAGGQGYTNNARNIARLSNGSEVSINAVNNGTVGSSGGAPNAANCLAANPNWIQNSSTAEYYGTIDGTQLNGNTIALTAEQTGLTPGQTYHIKLIITDVGDAAYDAVVYLEAGSFITSIPCTPPADPTGNTTQPDCTTPTGSINITSPTGATLEYSIDGVTYQSSTSFTGLIPGNYSAYVRDNVTFCISNTTAFTINEAPVTPIAPVAGTITQPTCTVATGSIDLSGLPTTGTWTITGSPSGSATGTGTTSTISGLAAGTTYTFTVTDDASGCTSVASTSVVVDAQPATPTAPIVGTITQPDCTTPTGSIALSGLPASGTWTVTGSPSGSFTSSGTTGTVTGLTPGSSYTFTVTNASGCTSVASTSTGVINAAPSVPAAPIVGTITQPTCTVATGSIALSGLPASGAWIITGSPSGSATGTGTTTTISGLAAGTSYTFTVTNASGCASTASTSANINTAPGAPTAPVIGTITQPTCTVATGSIELSGLPASGTWTVTGSPSGSATGTGTTTTISGLAAGTSYIFTVTNDLGCTSSASTSGVLNAQPTTPSAPVVGTVTQPDCTTPAGSVALSGLPVSGTWTVTGSPSGSSTGTGTTTTISDLAAGTSYTFTVTNELGCTSSASASGVLNAQPVTPTAPVLGAVTQPNCSITTGSVELSGLPSGAWIITDSFNGTYSGTGVNTIISGLSPNSYSFIVTEMINGCTSIASNPEVIITPLASVQEPEIVNISQPNCNNATGTIELSGLPASGNWTITGSPSGSATGTGTTTTISGLAAGTSYTFTVTNDLGCTSSASAEGVLNAQPASPSAPIVGTITQPDCTTPTGSVDLSGLPASGTWTVTGSPSGSLTSTGTIGTVTGLTQGSSYTFTVTNVDGCTSTTSADAVINSLPAGPSAPTGTATQPTCIVTTGTIEVTAPIGNFSYSIDGTNFQSSTTFVSVAPGSYSITVQEDNTGCTTTSTTQVMVDPVPSSEVIILDPDNSIAEGQSITINASGNGSISWDNGDNGSPISVSPLITTTYCATLTDANGCTDSDCITITVNSVPVVCGDLFIPTAFSPNGDGTNNSFGVSINLDCVESIDVKVFDRWGEVVFETTDAAQRWDGTYKTKELDPAVFVYVICIKTSEMTDEETFKGNVTLMK